MSKKDFPFDLPSEVQFEKTSVFSYVCFLDLLGFKNLLYEAEKSKKSCPHLTHNEILVKIKYLGDIILNYANKGLDKEESNKFKVLMVSDSIYIFFNLENIDLFFDILSLIIVYSSLHNLYYRGAISTKESLSPTYSNTSLFLGNGIIESYETERDISRYPRITIVDDIFLQDSDKYSGYIAIDKDGIRYLKIFEFLKNNYSRIRAIYHSFKETITIFEECSGCKDIETCNIDVKPKNLPTEFNSFIKQLSIEIKVHMNNVEIKKQKRIYSKYYELEKELSNYE